MIPRERNQDGEPKRIRAQAVTTVVAMGASMGGAEALEKVLSGLSAECQPVIIVQHIPEKLEASLAKRLQKSCAAQVRVAENGALLRPGLVLVAPGGAHMVLRRRGADFYVAVKDGPQFHYHKPSVDVLFRSVAKHAGANAVGVLLTGMGKDGAAGLKLMRNAGATTIAQDESTSLIFGMPKSAIELGAAAFVLPLEKIAGKITAASSGAKRRARPVSAERNLDVAVPGIPPGTLKPLWMANVLYKVSYEGKRKALFN
jgi:two-component system chemotaxis response regulator CheB